MRAWVFDMATLRRKRRSAPAASEASSPLEPSAQPGAVVLVPWSELEHEIAWPGVVERASSVPAVYEEACDALPEVACHPHALVRFLGYRESSIRSIALSASLSLFSSCTSPPNPTYAPLHLQPELAAAIRSASRLVSSDPSQQSSSLPEPRNASAINKCTASRSAQSSPKPKRARSTAHKASPDETRPTDSGAPAEMRASNAKSDARCSTASKADSSGYIWHQKRKRSNSKQAYRGESPNRDQSPDTHPVHPEGKQQKRREQAQADEMEVEGTAPTSESPGVDLESTNQPLQEHQSGSSEQQVDVVATLDQRQREQARLEHWRYDAQQCQEQKEQEKLYAALDQPQERQWSHVSEQKNGQQTTTAAIGQQQSETFRGQHVDASQQHEKQVVLALDAANGGKADPALDPRGGAGDHEPVIVKKIKRHKQHSEQRKQDSEGVSWQDSEGNHNDCSRQLVPTGADKGQHVSSSHVRSTSQECDMPMGRCHQCRESKMVARCGNSFMSAQSARPCKKAYCVSCLEEYRMAKEHCEVGCPSCRERCSCRRCMRHRLPIEDFSSMNREKRKNFAALTLGSIEAVVEGIQAEIKFAYMQIRIMCPELLAEEPAVRSTEDGLRLSCDICRTSIFDEYFTCSCCGSDFCPSCLALSLRQERGFERKFTFVEFDENCGGDKCSDGSSGMHNTKHFVHLLERKKLPHSMWEEKLLQETEVLASCRKQLHKQYLMQDTSTTTSNECCPWCPYLSTDEKRVASRYARQDDSIWTPDASAIDRDKLSMAAYDEILAHFQWHLVRGHPVIVRNVKGRMSWNDQELIRAAGSEEIANETAEGSTRIHAEACWTATASTSIAHLEMDLQDFFCGFKNAAHAPRPPMEADTVSSEAFDSLTADERLFKLRDYPVSGTLEEKMPKLYSDFINMVPFGEYTNPKYGPMNMATHMPEGSVPPDLGPKSYIAYGRTSERGPGDSVTRLHLDLADAVNVLMHSVDAFNEEKEGAGAVWHLFRREDRRGLEDFLMRNQAKLHYARCGDKLSQATVAHPIHDQVFMLTSEDLAQLQKEESVQPWTIEQNDHEAIFVPGGVAHQVRNRRSCIKVALDYVSPESSRMSCDDNVRDFAKLRRSEGLQGRMMASAAARNAMAVLKAERCGNESDR